MITAIKKNLNLEKVIELVMKPVNCQQISTQSATAEKEREENVTILLKNYFRLFSLES